MLENMLIGVQALSKILGGMTVTTLVVTSLYICLPYKVKNRIYKQIKGAR